MEVIAVVEEMANDMAVVKDMLTTDRTKIEKETVRTRLIERRSSGRGKGSLTAAATASVKEEQTTTLCD